MIFGLVELKLDFRIISLVLSNHSTVLLKWKKGAEDFEFVLIDLFTVCEVFGDAHGQKGHHFG